MPLYIPYLYKLSISMGVVWLFYQLLLRRLTFYTWNRWYLLIYPLFCFVIPLIDVRLFVSEKAFDRPVMLLSEIPVIWSAPGHLATHPTATSWNIWDIVPVILITVAMLLLIRLSVRLISLSKLRRRTKPADGGGKFRVYDLDKPIIPFSFGRSIFINSRLHSHEEVKEIILHEYVHVRQHHTADVILSELLGIVNWYNPFAWLLRHTIRQNLEFIADDQVIRTGADKIEYQYHLLKVVGVAEYRIANSFNFSSLKKRIVMMNKIKSARLHLVRFLFIFPLLAVLLVAFRNKYASLAAEKCGEAAMAAAATTETTSSLPVTSSVKEMRSAAKNKATRPTEIAAKRRVFVPGSILATETNAVRDTLPVKDTIRIQGGGYMIADRLEKPLFVIDGKKMPAGFSAADFSRAKFSVPIENVIDWQLLRDKAASEYGEEDFKDVIVISTTRKNPFPAGYGGVTLLVPDTSLNDVEYYINGVLSNTEAAKRLVHTWNIESVGAGGFKDKITGKKHYVVRYVLKKEVGPADSSRMLFLIDTLHTIAHTTVK